MTTRQRSAGLSRPAAALTGSRVRELAFAGLLAAYAVLTVGVLVSPSPVLRLDQWWVDLHMWSHHPKYYTFVFDYVMLGQRGPVAAVFTPLFAWLAWRRRTTEPLVMLATSLLLLNLSVGVVKYTVGRVGPRQTDDVHQVFSGGTLFPSGHVSNTVVMYGVLAMVIPRYRKWIVAGVVFLCLTVGLGTIYLRTHWFSDVIGGWIAGGLVLLALPEVMPFAQRWADRALGAYLARRRRRRGTDFGSDGAVGSETVVSPASRPRAETLDAPEPVKAGSAGRSAQRNATPVS